VIDGKAVDVVRTRERRPARLEHHAPEHTTADFARLPAADSYDADPPSAWRRGDRDDGVVGVEHVDRRWRPEIGGQKLLASGPWSLASYRFNEMMTVFRNASPMLSDVT
jgi:hypothetical protein